MPSNRRGSPLPPSMQPQDSTPAIFVTLAASSGRAGLDGEAAQNASEFAQPPSTGNLLTERSPAESQVALGNAVFAHLRRMHGPSVHVSVTFGSEPTDECVTVGIRPDPEFAIVQAISAMREAQTQTGATRNSSVRVVLPDGIVLDSESRPPEEVSLFESADGRLAILVDGWSVTGFERLVGWRLVADARALLAGETIPTHTRWVDDGAALMVWTDARFLFGDGDGGTGLIDHPPLPVAGDLRGARAAHKPEPDPWRTTWEWIASVTRDGEVRHVEDPSPRCRRILDLPPVETPDAMPTPVRPARMRRRG